MTVTQVQVSCEVNGETVILHFDSGNYFGLNDVGTLVWKMIQQPYSVRDLRDAILSEYEVELRIGETKGPGRSPGADYRDLNMIGVLESDESGISPIPGFDGTTWRYDHSFRDSDHRSNSWVSTAGNTRTAYSRCARFTTLSNSQRNPGCKTVIARATGRPPKLQNGSTRNHNASDGIAPS